MAGAFSKTKYETDGGSIVNIKVQPETLAANITDTNDAPSGSVTAGFPSAAVQLGRREIGIKARAVSLEFTATLPTGYKGGLVRIPILTKALYDAISVGSTGTYLGAAVRVVGKSPESIR